MHDVGWEAGHLVPVTPERADDTYGYVASLSEAHPLMVAVRGYALALRRACVQTHDPLPARFGQLVTVNDYPYVAFSRDEWHKAYASTRRSGYASLGRTVVGHRPGKNHAIRTSRGLIYDRHAPVTHCTLQVSAALPRLPRQGKYFRAWMLRTPPLRVEDDRAAGGEAFLAAYDDLWADLARRVEEVIPLALADLVARGSGS